MSHSFGRYNLVSIHYIDANQKRMISRSLWWWSRVPRLSQEEVRRLQALCEAERAAVPEEARRQLADAEVALSQALDECRAALCQNRQVGGLHLQLLGRTPCTIAAW